MKKINLLLLILLTNFLNQVLYAELLQELDVFSITLSNLANKLKPVGSGRPLPPPPEKKPTKPVVPPPLIPEKKPVSEPEPKFAKTVRVDYGENTSGSPMQIKVGLVDVGIGLVATDKGFDLVVHGPKLTDAKPQNFIVKHEIKLPGELVAKEVDKLSFPIDKAKDIMWSSNNKVLQAGPLANFTLVKGADYQALKKQEKEAQIFKSAIIESINKSNKDTKGSPSLVLNRNNIEGWLTKIKVATGLCESVVEKNFPNILKEEINTLGNQANKIITSILPRIGSMPDIMRDLNAEKDKLNKCLNNFNALQEKPSLESVLYEFYEAYLKSTPKTSDWWVITPRKMKEPATPTGPTIELNLSNVEYVLKQDYFEAFKKLDENEREKFVFTKTNYKNPKTGAFFTIKELLSYYISRSVADNEEKDKTLEIWNININGPVVNYSWPK